MRKYIILVMLVFLGVSTFPKAGKLTLREVDFSRFPEVNVTFELKTPDDLWEIGIGRNEIKILEEGTPLEFDLVTKNVYLIAAVDVSGSMKKHFDLLKRELINFLENIEYNLKMKLCIFGTTKKGGIEIFPKKWQTSKDFIENVEKLKAYGATPLYDSIWKCLEELQRVDGVKFLLVFTDGKDENYAGTGPGSIRTLGDILLKKSDAIIFTIGVGKDIKKEPLVKIAERFKGRYIEMKSPGDFSKVYDTLKERINSVHKLSFKANGGRKAYVIVDKGTYQASAVINYPGRPTPLMPPSPPTLSKIVPHRIVYLPVGRRGVVAIDSKTMNTIWEKDLGAFVEDVEELEDVLYAACGYSGVMALDPKTGRIFATYDVEGYVNSVEVFNGKLYAGIAERGVVLLEDLKRRFSQDAFRKLFLESKKEVTIPFENSKTLFMGDVTDLEASKDRMGIVCRDSFVIVDSQGSIVHKISLGGSPKRIRFHDDEIFLVDEEKGVFSLKNGKLTRVLEKKGVVDFLDGFALDQEKGTISEIHDGKVKPISYPEKLRKIGETIFITDWFGNVSVLDEDLRCLKFIPTKAEASLKFVNGTWYVLHNYRLFSYEGNGWKKHDFRGEVLDIDGKDGIYYIAMGRSGVGVFNRDWKQVNTLTQRDAFRLCVFRNKLFVYDLQEGFKIFDISIPEKPTLVSEFPFDRVVLSMKGEDDGIIAQLSEGFAKIEDGRIRVFEVPNAVHVYPKENTIFAITYDGYLMKMERSGDVIGRMFIVGFPKKVLSSDSGTFVLLSSGNVLKLKKWKTEKFLENVVDMADFENGVAFLIFENGDFRVVSMIDGR